MKHIDERRVTPSTTFLRNNAVPIAGVISVFKTITPLLGPQSEAQSIDPTPCILAVIGIILFSLASRSKKRYTDGGHTPVYKQRADLIGWVKYSGGESDSAPDLKFAAETHKANMDAICEQERIKQSQLLKEYIKLTGNRITMNEALKQGGPQELLNQYRSEQSKIQYQQMLEAREARATQATRWMKAVMDIFRDSGNTPSTGITNISEYEHNLWDKLPKKPKDSP